MLDGYLNALRSMTQDYDVAGTPDINVLARLPGVLQPKRDAIGDEITDGLMRALDEAVKELDLMRAQEGAALSTAIKSHLDQIESRLPEIEAIIPQQIENNRARLLRRIEELTARTIGERIEIDAGRLAQEVAHLAERSDIAEELERLRSHLTQFRESLDVGGEVGKRLDFLTQELNREANTMLSKSTDAGIKEAALVIKSEIEKIREQVQNIE